MNLTAKIALWVWSLCKTFEGLINLAAKESPVGVVFVRVSGVKAHSRKKQPCGCVKSVKG